METEDQFWKTKDKVWSLQLAMQPEDKKMQK